VLNGTSSLDDTAAVYVVIRADAIDGAELGTSLAVSIPKPFDGAVRFEFPGVVPLEIGRRYVIEARRAHGPGNPLLAMGHLLGSCPGVSGYFQGTFFPSGGDFWHRTGFDATPARRPAWGEVKLRYR
jgi:hypothetical protein